MEEMYPIGFDIGGFKIGGKENLKKTSKKVAIKQLTYQEPQLCRR